MEGLYDSKDFSDALKHVVNNVARTVNFDPNVAEYYDMDPRIPHFIKFDQMQRLVLTPEYSSYRPIALAQAIIQDTVEKYTRTSLSSPFEQAPETQAEKPPTNR